MKFGCYRLLDCMFDPCSLVGTGRRSRAYSLDELRHIGKAIEYREGLFGTPIGRKL